MKDLYGKYIDEVKADVLDKWESREQYKIDMKVLKSWYVDGWAEKEEKMLSSEYVRKFTELKHIKNAENKIAQLLGSKELLITLS